MKYWLVKSEAEVYSINHLKKDKKTSWDGVRNYQARNFMKSMELGDTVFFYHSNSDPTGIAGIAKVSKVSFPDPSQFDKKSKYYDEDATPDNPRWFCTEISFVEEFPKVITLESLRKVKELSEMKLLQKGSRLSVMPVEKDEYAAILKML